MIIETEAEQTAFADAAFRAWMRKVDAYIVRLMGVGADDLADYPYRVAFEDGYSPSEAGRAAIRAEGDEGGE